jgi:hypothetical protein
MAKHLIGIEESLGFCEELASRAETNTKRCARLAERARAVGDSVKRTNRYFPNP